MIQRPVLPSDLDPALSVVLNNFFDQIVRAQEVRDTAAPTVGSWKVGQRVWNSVPTAGGVMGWVCVTAGTPGTWEPFGEVDFTASKTWGV